MYLVHAYEAWRVSILYVVNALTIPWRIYAIRTLAVYFSHASMVDSSSLMLAIMGHICSKSSNLTRDQTHSSSDINGKLAELMIKLPLLFRLRVVKFKMPFLLLIRQKLLLSLFAHPFRIADSHINNLRIDLSGEFLDLSYKILLIRLDISAIK